VDSLSRFRAAEEGRMGSPANSQYTAIDRSPAPNPGGRIGRPVLPLASSYTAIA
jgi:hypothetical protein